MNSAEEKSGEKNGLVTLMRLASATQEDFRRDSESHSIQRSYQALMEDAIEHSAADQTRHALYGVQSNDEDSHD